MPLCESSNHPSINTISARLRANHNFPVVRMSRTRALEVIDLGKRPDATIPHGICWDHVLVMPSIDALHDKATEIARNCIELKVGITTNPSWRWYLCEGHNGMSSYFSDGWSRLMILTVDDGEVAGRQEVRLIDHVSKTCGTQTLNVRDGFDGPVKGHAPMFLYLAITLPK